MDELTNDMHFITAAPLYRNDFTFICANENNEILRLCENGDILIRGILCENDKEVVDAMREFLRSHGNLSS
jgi:hypothetical protein